MMSRKTIPFVGIAGAYWIAPLLTPQTKQTPLPNPINTTVCEVVGDSQRFDGKKIRFSARFASDIERSVLTDPKCSRGIIPFFPDKVENHPDIKAFDRALGQGVHGTMGKRVVATFTGRFVRQTKSSLGPCFGPCFVLEIERIDDLQVIIVDLKPHVAR